MPLDQLDGTTDLTVFQQFEVDPNLSEADYAYQTYQRLIFARKSHEVLFLVIGKLLKEIRDKKIYKTLDYETFTDFLGSEEVSYSKEAAFMFIRTFEYYVEYLEMEPEKVGEINVSRLSLMLPILKKIEDKTEVIKKIDELKSLRHKDFVLKVRQDRNTPKPSVYFSEELGKWIVEYYSDITQLHDLGIFADYQKR